MDDWYWIRAVMFKGAWLSASGDVADGHLMIKTFLNAGPQSVQIFLVCVHHTCI